MKPLFILLIAVPLYGASSIENTERRIMELEERVKKLEDGKQSRFIRDGEVYKCGICKRTFKYERISVGCAVLHPIDECCHYGQTEIMEKKK